MRMGGDGQSAVSRGTRRARSARAVGTVFDSTMLGLLEAVPEMGDGSELTATNGGDAEPWLE
jgi:hypothetical protein